MSADLDLEREYQEKKALVKEASFSNKPDVALVAFSWLLAQSDRDPERFPETDLLWSYKWVADNLPAFPQISRAKIDDTFADMERRFQRCGASLRPVHKIRCSAAIAMGDREQARKHFAVWVDARRDWVSDCPACDLDSQVEFLVLEERDEAALERARPIIDGSVRCGGVPHTTLASLLLPLLRLGRFEDAALLHERGDRLIAGSRRWVGPSAEHLLYLVLTRETERAERLLEHRLPWAQESPDLAKKFLFLGAARLLRPEMDEPARALAARFDARNGNDHFRRKIARNDELRARFA
jgi:hypothetical protein